MKLSKELEKYVFSKEGNVLYYLVSVERGGKFFNVKCTLEAYLYNADVEVSKLIESYLYNLAWRGEPRDKIIQLAKNLPFPDILKIYKQDCILKFGKYEVKIPKQQAGEKIRAFGRFWDEQACLPNFEELYNKSNIILVSEKC